MAALTGHVPGLEIFDAYFRRADLDMDGRISGAEAVSFFQGANLPKQILAQIWMYSDSSKSGFLGRQEFYNALRLVTVAQSGRELTPEIVKAALEGPAASKIPPPKINPGATSAITGNQIHSQRPILSSAATSSHQIGTITSGLSPNVGPAGSQTLPSANMNQQPFPSADSQRLRPNQAASFISSQPLVSQGFLGGGTAAGPQPTSSNIPNTPTAWPNGSIGGAPAGGASLVSRGTALQVTQAGLGLPQSSLTATTAPRAEVPLGTAPVSSKPLESFSSFQSSVNDPKALVVSGNGFSDSAAFGDVFAATPQKTDGFASSFATSSAFNLSGVRPASGIQSLVRPNKDSLSYTGSTMPQGSAQLQRTASVDKQAKNESLQDALSSAALVTSERPWPKFSQGNIQKYSKVFLEVDTDKDGKITGEQARALFLSWKLPREVLKQIWDLSDQDNDSMLSHREFVIALYLMERFREGYHLPSVIPNSVKYDEMLLQATAQPSASYSSPAWQPRPVFSQQGMQSAHPMIPAGGLKPNTQVQLPIQMGESMQLVQQKPSGLVSEQLSNEGHSSAHYEIPAKEADRKVQELEVVIMDSKEKIEFYRTQMQELVLYKSRCDNRLNEITEKASADKSEVETLAKKYEEKYKQVSDVASKLTMEEAIFRDIQERKAELQNAIVKMEQGGSADGLLQVRADRIQSDLENFVKVLNERCKKHGLDTKSTGIVELPFGWEPGIHEGAVVWDEDWDKFEDEGFVVSKELSASSVSSSLNVDKSGKLPNIGEEITITNNQSVFVHSEDGSTGSPGSPLGRSSLENQSQEFQSEQLEEHDSSPRTKESLSDHVEVKSPSGGEFADEMTWGAAFDTNNDADSLWDFNTRESERKNGGQTSFFSSGDFGLDPVRTDSPGTASVLGTNKSPFFEDSVPGTPLFNSGSSPQFGEGPEDRSFDNFGRFDSFSMHDSSFFPQRENLARFDSIRSTSDQSRQLTFDEPDAFGSSGPFKSSESQTPRRGSDKWSAF